MTKNLFLDMKIPHLMMGISALLFSVSCSKSNPTEPGPPVVPSIMEVVKTNTDFSLLAHALKVTSVDKVLEDNKDLTVFAPNNAAFTAADLDTKEKIEQFDKQELTKILSYHVTKTVYKASQLTGKSVTPTTLHADKLRLFISGATKILINNVEVAQADIVASNGVIHAIKQVIIPPTKTLAELITANTELSSLLTAAGTAGLTNDLGDKTKYFTVFAPNDAAFTAAVNVPTAEQALKNLLLAHLTGTVAFSGNISNGLVVNSSLPTPTTELLFSITNNKPYVRIKGKAEDTNAEITSVDAIATNGVLHVITKVLVP